MTTLRLFPALIWITLLSPCAAQQTVYYTVDSGDRSLFETLTQNYKPPIRRAAPGLYTISAPDSAGLTTGVRQLLRHLHAQSHLLASFDSVFRSDDSSFTARLYLGPAVRWASLRGVDKRLGGRIFRYDELLQMQENMLEKAENNGYPFAGVWLDSVETTPNGHMSAVLRSETGPFFYIKAIKIKGDVRLPEGFLSHFLGIKEGAPYSRAQTLRIRDQLRRLPFAELTAPPGVSFIGDAATINLYLNKKRASRFDFIVGFLPQANTGRVLLSGSLDAAFYNTFNWGERFALKIDRLRPETQQLDVQAATPYLLGAAFGLEGRLQIFKRDSAWVDAHSRLGWQYFFEGDDQVQLFWENKTSALQSVDTLAVLQTRRLPAVLDLRQNGFGAEARFERLDDRFNPRKGWSLILRGISGFNIVRRNSRIENLSDPDDPSFQFAGLYDSLALRSVRWKGEAQVEAYIAFFQRTTLKIAAQGGGIFSSAPVYANEQYRLGGARLLRGFDEGSIPATRYAVATLEWRLLIGPRSYLAAFTDYAYIENRTAATRSFLRPWGIGAGMNFETKAGVFGISIAAGRSDAGQGFDFNATKFHIGYVSLF